ncbi:MAG: transposase family protein, partial [Bacteroidales bacterium]
MFYGSATSYVADTIKDPRVDRTKRHKLIDILFIAICSIICGGEGWEHMQTFGAARKDWLNLFLELPNGITG